MQVADAYGLTKNSKDGGEVIDLDECRRRLGSFSQEKVTSLANIYERAIFRAIDTDGDGYISRNEWSKFLKARKTYESEEQALRSFDSIDKNDDGRISMEEYEQAAIKFWRSCGKDDDVKDLFGKKHK